MGLLVCRSLHCLEWRGQLQTKAWRDVARSQYVMTHPFSKGLYNLWQQEKLKPRTKSSAAATARCDNMVTIGIELAYNYGLWKKNLIWRCFKWCHVALWKFRSRFEASGLPPLKTLVKYSVRFFDGKFLGLEKTHAIILSVVPNVWKLCLNTRTTGPARTHHLYIKALWVLQ